MIRKEKLTISITIGILIFIAPISCQEKGEQNSNKQKAQKRSKKKEEDVNQLKIYNLKLMNPLEDTVNEEWEEIMEGYYRISQPHRVSLKIPKKYLLEKQLTINPINTFSKMTHIREDNKKIHSIRVYPLKNKQSYTKVITLIEQKIHDWNIKLFETSEKRLKEIKKKKGRKVTPSTFKKILVGYLGSKKKKEVRISLTLQGHWASGKGWFYTIKIYMNSEMRIKLKEKEVNKK